MGCAPSCHRFRSVGLHLAMAWLICGCALQHVGGEQKMSQPDTWRLEGFSNDLFTFKERDAREVSNSMEPSWPKTSREDCCIGPNTVKYSGTIYHVCHVNFDFVNVSEWGTNENHSHIRGDLGDGEIVFRLWVSPVTPDARYARYIYFCRIIMFSFFQQLQDQSLVQGSWLFCDDDSHHGCLDHDSLFSILSGSMASLTC